MGYAQYRSIIKPPALRMRRFGDSAVCSYHFGYISLSSPKRSHLSIPCTCNKMSNRTKASEQLAEFAKTQQVSEFHPARRQFWNLGLFLLIIFSFILFLDTSNAPTPAFDYCLAKPNFSRTTILSLGFSNHLRLIIELTLSKEFKLFTTQNCSCVKGAQQTTSFCPSYHHSPFATKKSIFGR